MSYLSEEKQRKKCLKCMFLAAKVISSHACLKLRVANISLNAGFYASQATLCVFLCHTSADLVLYWYWMRMCACGGTDMHGVLVEASYLRIKPLSKT
jgi:hypothetical protein